VRTVDTARDSRGGEEKRLKRNSNSQAKRAERAERDANNVVCLLSARKCEASSPRSFVFTRRCVGGRTRRVSSETTNLHSSDDELSRRI